MTRNPANKTGTKQQLLQELVCLKADLDREREEKNHFQLERDSMLVLKGVLEKKLQEAEVKLSSICKEREEAEERHQVEISVYKQKLKQVLSRQQSSTASTCKPVQNQNLPVQETLALNHQVELMEQSNRYSRKLRDVEVKFDLKMRTLVEEQERRRAAALRQLKQQTRSYVASLKEEHSRALRGEEELRSVAQEELRELKEELQEAQQLNKELSAAQEKNRGLEEALEEARKRLQDLRRAEEEAADLRSSLKEAQEELGGLREENRLLLRGFCKVQQERDELLRRQEHSMADLQRRSALKEELLHRKLRALNRFLERKEAQLLVALSPPAGDPAESGTGEELKEDSEVQGQQVLD
ncbi:Growth arrest-specific protein 8 [Oryzias melastigma]|uniref:Dynein regulatory complex subunit 4 n=1 Tax=Oryzias melastigma TaxID=30732 RepID=A0A834FHH7_ORYME|nr:Growth arrest-specific protein 8 [Oryzias melastigma]